jgi:peptide/nickel transport system permease protein
MKGDIVRLVVRRLVGLVLVILVVSFGAFALVDAAPGSAEQLLLGFRPQTPEAIEAIRAEYHLDEPFLERYARWLAAAAQLDFGRSLATQEPVLPTVLDQLLLTALLSAYAFTIAVVLGVPLGVLAALRHRSPIDRGIVAASVIAVSAPAFATGTFLLYLFAAELGWFPAFGQGEGVGGRLYHLTLPALALAASVMALLVRLTRAALVEALRQQYVTFARACGIRPRTVLVSYGLRNALVPIVTAGGLVLAALLSGAVLVEVTFALPGLGSLLTEAIKTQDVTMVQGVAVVTAVVFVSANLLVDIAYVVIDPRIRFASRVP